MLSTHCSQQLQREGKAELALIDAVDENLHVNSHTLTLQAPGQFLVGQPFLLPEVFDDGFGASLVESALVHGRSYMEFSLSASYKGPSKFSLYKSNSMYV